MKRRVAKIAAFLFLLLAVAFGRIFFASRPASGPVERTPAQSTEKTPPIAEKTPPPETTDDRAKRAQDELAAEAERCKERALEAISGEEPGTSAALERRWAQYLATIQGERDDGNWSDKPCELYLRKHVRSAADALSEGLVSIKVEGSNLELVNVAVTPTGPGTTTVVIPAGTLFVAQSQDDQNMISASAVGITTSTFSNPSGETSTTTVTQEVPVYCINRWRETPTAQSSFQPHFAQAEPLGKLARCLDTADAEHRAKQYAIWLVSDSLWDLSKTELAEKLRAEITHKLEKQDKAAAGMAIGLLLEQVRSERPDATDEEVLAALKGLSAEEAQQRLERVVATNPEGQVQGFVTVGGPLLRQCGYDTSSHALFRE